MKEVITVLRACHPAAQFSVHLVDEHAIFCVAIPPDIAFTEQMSLDTIEHSNYDIARPVVMMMIVKAVHAAYAPRDAQGRSATIHQTIDDVNNREEDDG